MKDLQSLHVAVHAAVELWTLLDETEEAQGVAQWRAAADSLCRAVEWAKATGHSGLAARLGACCVASENVAESQCTQVLTEVSRALEASDAKVAAESACSAVSRVLAAASFCAQ